jgi:hypothetical protein
LKTVLPRTNVPHHESMGSLAQFIETHTTYPYELIRANLERLGCDPLKGSSHSGRH